MIDLDIGIDGEDVIALWLRKGIDLDKPIAQGLGDWAADTLDDRLYGMHNYAPQPAGSTYVRTGRLGSNWGLQRGPGETAVTFYNMTSYAGYVVGDGEGQGQARHMGHWWLGRKRIEERLDGALDKIAKAIMRVLD